MRFAFVEEHRNRIPVDRLCNILGFTSRGYRAWRARPVSCRQRRGWLYLAVIIDLHSRRVVGWATSNRLKMGLALEALNRAVALRNPSPGCIHHSDRDSQYCSHDYQKRMRQLGFKVSMSRKGNCWDNSVAETFFKTLKAELIWRSTKQTRDQIIAALFQYINGFYNNRRRHSAIGGMAPTKFEQQTS